MHGGISPKLQAIDDIRRIQLPIEDTATGTLEEGKYMNLLIIDFV
jgi:hypothetical protein